MAHHGWNTQRFASISARAVCITAAILCLWQSSFITTASGTRTARQDTKEQHAAALVKTDSAKTHVSRPHTWKDEWYGKPPPKPGNFIKQTDRYRRWRLKFAKALRVLEKRGYGRTADDLRQWIYRFEAAEIKSLQGKERSSRFGDRSGRSLFRNPQVRRLISPPPYPAYKKFYGYKVVLPWNKAVYYYNPRPVPPGTPYLLHSNGVKYGGIPVRRRSDIHKLFKEAGVIDPVARHVLIQVSGCEGGFEAVNTWDTGYVSVGFIQFITGKTSRGHSLVRVLQRMKESEDRKSRKLAWHPNEYDYYFRKRGVDVQDGCLVVFDPLTRKKLVGADAVNAIIKDKRLTAIFQDAGLKSKAFKLAQIKEAYRSYYMVRNNFSVPAAVVFVYDLSQMPNPDSPIPSPVKKRYVYGSRAVQSAMAECITREQFKAGDRTSSDGKYCRVIMRLPDLRASYGDILRTQAGKTALVDRAVQHGVQNAALTFESCVFDLSNGKYITTKDLKLNHARLAAGLQNRIPVGIAQGPETRTGAGPGKR